MTQKGRVSPFGDPRIKGCSPLPAAFRSVPRPSSPLSAKASTKCPSTLDRYQPSHTVIKAPRLTQNPIPCPIAGLFTQHFIFFTRLAIQQSIPRQPDLQKLSLQQTATTRQPNQTASRIPIHNVKDQKSEVGRQKSVTSSPSSDLSRSSRHGTCNRPPGSVF